MKVLCPHCSMQFRDNPALAGKKVKCSRCLNPFEMPPPPAVIELDPSEIVEPPSTEAAPEPNLLDFLESSRPVSDNSPAKISARLRSKKATAKATAKKLDQAAKKFVLGCASVVGIFFLVIFVVAILSSSNSQKGSDEEIGAMVEAESYVKVYLKYPDDAEFIGYQNATKLDQDCWAIQGKVKTMNGFGAKLTQPYEVELQHRNGKWSLKGISVGGEDLYTDVSKR